MRRSKLDVWVTAGLISGEQAAAIRAYEERRPTRPWALYGVAGIGITAIITGIISLVAANWDAIPAAMKLASYLALQAGVGVAFVRRAAVPGLLREVLLSMFALLFLAGIGLVAQIYNLRSDGWQGLLFWLALSLPVTLLSQGRLMNHVWLAGLATTVGVWVNASFGQEEDLRVLCAITFAYLVLGVGLFQTQRPWLPPLLRRAAMQWGLAAVVALFPFVAAFAWAGEGLSLDAPLRIATLPWLGAIVAVGATLLGAPKYEPRLGRSLVFMIICSAAYVTLPYSLKLHDHDLLGAIGFMLVWAAAGAAAVFAGRKRLFDVVAFVIAARFVVVYFEVFGSLAATGIGLIVSGGVILGTVYVWHRFRGHIARWVGGLP